MKVLLLFALVASGFAETHRFEPKEFYNTFSSAHAPVLHIKPGDHVITSTIDARGVDSAGVQRGRGPNPETGPFYIEGAEPGDTLVVHLLRLETNRATGFSASLLAPYTWLVHLPGLAALREPDRLALLGLVGAAVLAGIAVDWLWRRARPLLAVVAVLAIFEAGWTGTPLRGVMPTSLPALDRPIAADHSGSIVLDVPFGLRGGLPLYGSATARPALLLATADGHPRAISYTSWVPKATTAWFKRHPFYVWLVAAQNGDQVPADRLAAARRDVRGIDIGWVLVWDTVPPGVIRYLTGTGFVFDYRADQVSVYRPGWK